MATTDNVKKYIGDWDTSAYDALSNASQKAYQTNWDILRNKYDQLVKENQRQEATARNTYSNILASQVNNITQVQDAINRNLSNRGISTSGARDSLFREQLGNNTNTVNSALKSLMGTVSGVVDSRLSGLNNLISTGGSLDSSLVSDLLGYANNKTKDELKGQTLGAELAENNKIREAKQAKINQEVNLLKYSYLASVLNKLDKENINGDAAASAYKELVTSGLFSPEEAVNAINSELGTTYAFTDKNEILPPFVKRGVDAILDVIEPNRVKHNYVEITDPEEIKRRISIMQILNNVDPSSGEPADFSDFRKAYLLKNAFNVENAEDIVKNYNRKHGSDERIKELKKELDKYVEVIDALSDTRSVGHAIRTSYPTITGGRGGAAKGRKVVYKTRDSKTYNKLKNEYDELVQAYLTNPEFMNQLWKD